MQMILDTLFRFLQPDHARYHERDVELLWEYNRLAEMHTLENVIARQLTSSLSKHNVKALEAFGVIWRLTDDAMLPGEIFYVPAFLVMDALDTSDPVVRGAAESWMRLDLRSHLRCVLSAYQS
jgi:hypothetical protein